MTEEQKEVNLRKNIKLLYMIVYNSFFFFLIKYTIDNFLHNYCGLSIEEKLENFFSYILCFLVVNGLQI